MAGPVPGATSLAVKPACWSAGGAKNGHLGAAAGAVPFPGPEPPDESTAGTQPPPGAAGHKRSEAGRASPTALGSMRPSAISIRVASSTSVMTKPQ
jgi:hypothetical protein